MDPIPKEEMGNATSMFNLMRNLGGSVGIAAVTTYLARREQFHLHPLGAHVQTWSPQTRSMVRGLRGAFIARGADAHTALQRALAVLWGMVQRHAAMAAFVDTFLPLALVFLMVLPMLLLMKKPRHYSPGGGMH
jgi:DHA2 family multidrug resistance protein